MFELAGPDRAGLLAEVTHLLTHNGCNVRSAAVRPVPLAVGMPACLTHPHGQRIASMPAKQQPQLASSTSEPFVTQARKQKAGE